MEVAVGEALSGGARVVAAVEPDGLDVTEQPPPGGGVEGRCEEDRVVAVRAVDRPADRDAVAVGEDRPLPAELAPIRGVLAGSLATTRAFVQRTVDGDVGEIEADDPVVGRCRLLRDGVEDAGSEPFVAPLPRRGVGDPVAAEPLGVLPRATRGEPDEHHREAVPVRGPGPVTSERVRLDQGWDERFDGRPDGIEHFGVERAHDGVDLHSVVGR